jgi:hypothetical protein
MQSVSSQPRRLYAGRFFDQVTLIVPRAGGRKSITSANCAVCGKPVAIDAPPSKRRESFATGNGAVCTVCCPAL